MRNIYCVSIALCGLLAGCVSYDRTVELEPVGPQPPVAPSVLRAGTLIVYTPDDYHWTSDARVPSSYRIYSEMDQLLRDVPNHTTGSIDQDPTPITLPAGKYKIRARADGYGLVTVPVVVEEGRITQVFLDHGGSILASRTEAANLVRLPSGAIIGYRATPVAYTP